VANEVANVEITSLKQAVQEYERKLFIDLYKKHRTSTGVAKAAKISQSSAARKLRQYVPQYTERE
jgi:TyrR family helix-turn-helix protein